VVRQRDLQTYLDSVEYRSMDRLRIVRSIDQDAARGVVCRDLLKALAQPVVESAVEALKSVADIPSRGHTRETRISRQIEDNSQVRSKTPESEAM
jgi:hypothetical protein